MALIVLAAVGLILASIGAALIYPPAGLIAAGVVLMFAAFREAERGKS